MTRHIETCGAWIRHLQRGSIDGERGNVCWTDPMPDGLMFVGIQPCGSQDYFTHVIHRCDLPGVLKRLAHLVGFDHMQALGLAQGVLETDTEL